jgi:hypothetical protein
MTVMFIPKQDFSFLRLPTQSMKHIIPYCRWVHSLNVLLHPLHHTQKKECSKCRHERADDLNATAYSALIQASNAYIYAVLKL